nr:hypothetical protein [Actinomycetota bacterium]
ARAGDASPARTAAPPVVVLADVFNEAGANTGFFDGSKSAPSSVLLLQGGEALPGDAHESASSTALVPRYIAPKPPGPLHVVRVIIGVLFLLLPGLIAFRWLFPNGSVADALGMVPALAATALCLAGILVLAIARSPLSTSLAFTSWAIAALGALAIYRFVRVPSRARPDTSPNE